MKYIVLLLLSAMFALSQDEDPFGEGASTAEPKEMEYDFADIHKWDDTNVDLSDKVKPKYITWQSTFLSSHRGVKGTMQSFSFKLSEKLYKTALQHPENNRGVVLFSGDTRFPSLYCWLRPMGVSDGYAYFHFTIPLERLNDIKIAFLPAGGKKRYIYNLNSVVQSLKRNSKAKKQ